MCTTTLNVHELPTRHISTAAAVHIMHAEAQALEYVIEGSMNLLTKLR